MILTCVILTSLRINIVPDAYEISSELADYHTFVGAAKRARRPRIVASLLTAGGVMNGGRMDMLLHEYSLHEEPEPPLIRRSRGLVAAAFAMCFAAGASLSALTLTVLTPARSEEPFRVSVAIDDEPPSVLAHCEHPVELKRTM